jgi:serine/threonine-protein kinase
MASSDRPLLERLLDSGVLSPADAAHVQATLDSDQLTGDPPQLAEHLVRMSKLTPYQADTISTGDLTSLTLGSYVILDRLGEGGMGHVYKARHREMDRVVAIKVLPPERLGSESGQRRFQQEVKAAARLSHPNIVTAFDADVSGGIPYLVMEYVEGRDLQAMLAQRGPLAVHEALDYILQAAHGLEYAHRVGVIHRDIKPGNLLVDEDGAVRILDMGVAQVRDISPPDDVTKAAQITRDGTVVGTVDFMAPEQAASAKNADQRSDIYSLGCTLYYLLTNAPVYGGDSVFDRLLAHRERPVPSLREARREVTKGLDAVFQRMIAKRPEDRYQTMTDVIEELGRVRLGRRPLTRPAGNALAPHAAPRRISLLSFILVLAAVFAAGLLGLIAYDQYFAARATLTLVISQADAHVRVSHPETRRTWHEQQSAHEEISMRLPQGVYQVEVTKPGFEPQTNEIILRPRERKRFVIELLPTGQSPGFIDDLIENSAPDAPS